MSDPMNVSPWKEQFAEIRRLEAENERLEDLLNETQMGELFLKGENERLRKALREIFERGYPGASFLAREALYPPLAELEARDE